MENVKLLQGDCLELMQDIPDKSIDLILTDPPYGTTACKWDSVIPFDSCINVDGKYYTKEEFIDKFVYKSLSAKDTLEEIKHKVKEANYYFEENKTRGMWEQLNRIIKANGAIALFGSEPFASTLRMSNIKQYKYDWIWEKENGTNFATVKYQPFRKTERILIFGDFATSYNKKRPKNYNPQFSIGTPYKINRKDGQREQLHKGANKATSLNNNGYRYPTDIIKFNNEKGFHPTQKPVPLLEYLIKTYTSENETVLDFTMGSGSTGVACINTNRKFIGIELDKKYFNVAKERIEKGE